MNTEVKSPRMLLTCLIYFQAIAHNRLYIVDYYDAFLPFVEKANQVDDNKMYASQTVFFLTDGILKPIAIEFNFKMKYRMGKKNVIADAVL